MFIFTGNIIMKVTVCEISNSVKGLAEDWNALVEHVNSNESELVLLPELSFSTWLAETPDYDPVLWQEAVDAHDKWIARFNEMPNAMIAGSRAVIRNKINHNDGYIWDSINGYRKTHTKYYLPIDNGFFEASWFKKGAKEFIPVETEKAKLGYQVCTDLWFSNHAWDYGKQGVDIILNPRATPMCTREKWIAGGRTTSVVSGCYCLSSNFSGVNDQGFEFAGRGWIIEPKEGDILGMTNSKNKFLTLDINLNDAKEAKNIYPRNVEM
jgi:N-carbamoylputrescine amidase